MRLASDPRRNNYSSNVKSYEIDSDDSYQDQKDQQKPNNKKHRDYKDSSSSDSFENKLKKRLENYSDEKYSDDDDSE